MSKHAQNDKLSEIDARLKHLKGDQSKRSGSVARAPSSGYGMAFTLVADLVGGLFGGALVGWLVDRWAGSAPLGLITFFILGALAGMWNVYRTVRGLDMSLGFGRPSAEPPTTFSSIGMPTGVRSEEESGDHGGQPPPSVRNPPDCPDSHRQP
jgi:ATP synthase protein I